jgi:hypothetical protein
MTYELKEMTATSWILQNNGVRVAVITETENGLNAIGKLDRKIFGDLNDLAKFLGSNIEIVKPTEDDHGDVFGDICGYPVKHQPVAPSEDHETLPVYKRGKVSHSAGYYGIRFKNGWVTSFCPKLSTLEENEYVGPFRTRLEMLNSISQKKREIEI